MISQEHGLRKVSIGIGMMQAAIILLLVYALAWISTPILLVSGNRALIETVLSIQVRIAAPVLLTSVILATIGPCLCLAAPRVAKVTSYILVSILLSALGLVGNLLSNFVRLPVWMLIPIGIAPMLAHPFFVLFVRKLARHLHQDDICRLARDTLLFSALGIAILLGGSFALRMGGVAGPDRMFATALMSLVALVVILFAFLRYLRMLVYTHRALTIAANPDSNLIREAGGQLNSPTSEQPVACSESIDAQTTGSAKVRLRLLALALLAPLGAVFMVLFTSLTTYRLLMAAGQERDGLGPASNGTEFAVIGVIGILMFGCGMMHFALLARHSSATAQNLLTIATILFVAGALSIGLGEWRLHVAFDNLAIAQYYDPVVFLEQVGRGKAPLLAGYFTIALAAVTVAWASGRMVESPKRSRTAAVVASVSFALLLIAAYQRHTGVGSFSVANALPSLEPSRLADGVNRAIFSGLLLMVSALGFSLVTLRKAISKQNRSV